MARIEGVHRARAETAKGKFVRYHYAWRGGPRFWSSSSDVREGSDEYIAALNEKRQRKRLKGILCPEMVDRFRDSAEFMKLADRTKNDYRIWAERFAEMFHDAPAAMFEWPESRGELLEWRDQWQHSPKQADYAITVSVRILSWAVDRSIIRQHHCHRIAKLYENASRAEIIWKPEEVEKFESVAPEWVRRGLIVALETGMRPGDLIRFSRNHIEATPSGRRISIRTNKRKRLASMPVTPKLSEIIDGTPKDRLLILASQRGKPLTEHRISEGVRQWRDKAGLRDDLRLYDCRGTAATKLLRAGAKLEHIAGSFGWSLRYAQNVIESYAAVSPDVADEIRILLAVQAGKAKAAAAQTAERSGT